MSREWESYSGPLSDCPGERHDWWADEPDDDKPTAADLADDYGEPVPVLHRGCGHTNRDVLAACCQEAARRELAGDNQERGAA